MRFNELKVGQAFIFPEGPQNKYRVVFKSDSTIHYTDLVPKHTYIILKEYFSWYARVMPIPD